MPRASFGGAAAAGTVVARPPTPAGTALPHSPSLPPSALVTTMGPLSPIGGSAISYALAVTSSTPCLAAMTSPFGSRPVETMVAPSAPGAIPPLQPPAADGVELVDLTENEDLEFSSAADNIGAVAPAFPDMTSHVTGRVPPPREAVGSVPLASGAPSGWSRGTSGAGPLHESSSVSRIIPSGAGGFDPPQLRRTRAKPHLPAMQHSAMMPATTPPHGSPAVSSTAPPPPLLPASSSGTSSAVPSPLQLPGAASDATPPPPLPVAGHTVGTPPQSLPPKDSGERPAPPRTPQPIVLAKASGSQHAGGLASNPADMAGNLGGRLSHSSSRPCLPPGQPPPGPSTNVQEQLQMHLQLQQLQHQQQLQHLQQLQMQEQQQLLHHYLQDEEAFLQNPGEGLAVDQAALAMNSGIVVGGSAGGSWPSVQVGHLDEPRRGVKAFPNASLPMVSPSQHAGDSAARTSSCEGPGSDSGGNPRMKTSSSGQNLPMMQSDHHGVPLDERRKKSRETTARHQGPLPSVPADYHHGADVGLGRAALAAGDALAEHQQRHKGYITGGSLPTVNDAGSVLPMRPLGHDDELEQMMLHVGRHEVVRPEQQQQQQQRLRVSQSAASLPMMQHADLAGRVVVSYDDISHPPSRMRAVASTSALPSMSTPVHCADGQNAGHRSLLDAGPGISQKRSPSLSALPQMQQGGEGGGFGSFEDLDGAGISWAGAHAFEKGGKSGGRSRHGLGHDDQDATPIYTYDLHQHIMGADAAATRATFVDCMANLQRPYVQGRSSRWQPPGAEEGSNVSEKQRRLALQRRVDQDFVKTLRDADEGHVDPLCWREAEGSNEDYEGRFRDQVRSLRESGGLLQPRIVSAYRCLAARYGFDARVLSEAAEASVRMPSPMSSMPRRSGTGSRPSKGGGMDVLRTPNRQVSKRTNNGQQSVEKNSVRELRQKTAAAKRDEDNSGTDGDTEDRQALPPGGMPPQPLCLSRAEEEPVSQKEKPAARWCYEVEPMPPPYAPPGSASQLVGEFRCPAVRGVTPSGRTPMLVSSSTRPHKPVDGKRRTSRGMFGEVRFVDSEPEALLA
eukprot:TRINITY_DN1958_c3_g1_i1.p1 TRINITY_DN1958_c3_g1~~TRINITY_DN1958_c3_g1_i1.p1  ORF type:complete len:1070 (-),score=228.15 TRINITY_DN1958_c3_g1_i1:242-3451(-)